MARRAQFVGALVLSCLAARANADEIGIVALASNVDREILRGVRATIDREILANTALDLAPPESIAVEVTQGALRACAGDADCFAALVGRRFDHLLVVSLSRIADTIVVGLRWIELDRERAVERGLDARTVTSEQQLGAELPLALAAVFGQRWGEAGSLLVQADPPNAEITIGTSVCLSPCRVERLLAGTYAVGVRAQGFIGERVDVVVKRGETTSLPIALAREPESLSPWLWIAGSAVVVGVAVTAIVIASSSSPTTLCLKDAAAVCSP